MRKPIKPSKRTKPTLRPELIDSAQVANVIGSNRHAVRAMARHNEIPQPLRLPRRVPLWRRDELKAWIDAGCPTPAIPPIWVYRPYVSAQLSDYCQLLTNRIALLQRELEAAQARVDAGEVHSHVRKIE